MKTILFILFQISMIFNIGCVKYITSFDELKEEIYSKKRDNALIIRSIERGFDINIQDTRGKTFLHDAGITNNFKLFNYLITKGALINIKDSAGRTPLRTAASSFEMVQILVKHGADINTIDDLEGNSILHIAPIEIVQYLLDHGADPNIKNSYDQTPFDSAMWNQNYEKAKILRPVTKNPMPAWLKEYNKLFKE